jgi:hypothetical protein
MLRISESNQGVDRRAKLGIIFTIWWYLWKERNRRIFDNKECSIPQLSALFNDDRTLFQVDHVPDVI